MIELIAIRYASGSDIDQDHLDKIQKCRIKEKDAITSAGGGYTPDISPPITFERVKDISSINIGNY